MVHRVTMVQEIYVFKESARYQYLNINLQGGGLEVTNKESSGVNDLP